MTHFLLRDAGPGGLLTSGVLLRSQLVRMLVASLIEAYGPAVRTVDAVLSGDVRPPAVRRAVAYLEDAAAENVRISVSTWFGAGLPRSAAAPGYGA